MLPPPSLGLSTARMACCLVQPGRYQQSLREMTEETWMVRGQHENLLPPHFLCVISQNALNTLCLQDGDLLLSVHSFHEHELDTCSAPGPGLGPGNPGN